MPDVVSWRDFLESMGRPGIAKSAVLREGTSKLRKWFSFSFCGTRQKYSGPELVSAAAPPSQYWICPISQTGELQPVASLVLKMLDHKTSWASCGFSEPSDIIAMLTTCLVSIVSQNQSQYIRVHSKSTSAAWYAMPCQQDPWPINNIFCWITFKVSHH